MLAVGICYNVSIGWVDIWGINSAGQSASFARKKSSVRIRYAPPKYFHRSLARVILFFAKPLPSNPVRVKLLVYMDNTINRRN